MARVCSGNRSSIVPVAKHFNSNVVQGEARYGTTSINNYHNKRRIPAVVVVDIWYLPFVENQHRN